MKGLRIILLFFVLPGYSQDAAEEWIERHDAFKGSDEEAWTNDVESIDLNRATRNDLEQLPVLNDSEINQILEYRKTSGKYLSIYELQALRILSPDTFQAIKPFIYVTEKPASTKSQGYALIRMDQCLETKEGYKNAKYLGTPQRIILRTRWTSHRWNTGLTMEKDSGEPLGGRYYPTGIDHVTGFIQYSSRHAQLIVGDFRALWGQGLVVGNGFGMGKGREPVLSIQRNGRSTPYQSLSEYGFFRGVHFATQTGAIQVRTFLSQNSFDSNPSSEVRSISTSGLTRTEADLEKNANLTQTSVGLQLGLNLSSLRLGVGLLGYRYLSLADSIKFEPKTNGHSQHALASVYYQWTHKNAAFFGETAMGLNRSLALSQGVQVSLSHSVDLALHYRKFSGDYYSPYANQSFREGPRTSNEEGLYVGLKITPTSSLSIHLFADSYVFPSVANLLGKATGGDLMASISMEGNDVLTRAYFRYRSRDVAMKLPSDKSYSQALRASSYGNLDVSIPLTESLSTKVGAWVSQVHLAEERTWGTMVYQDLHWDVGKTKITGRVAMVNVPDYENRFYLYEPDVNLAFTVPVYYGQSVKYVLVYKQKLLRSLSFQMKVSRTMFLDRQEIGSGDERIDGNKKTEVKMQLMARF